MNASPLVINCRFNFAWSLSVDSFSIAYVMLFWDKTDDKAPSINSSEPYSEFSNSSSFLNFSGLLNVSYIIFSLIFWPNLVILLK